MRGRELQALCASALAGWLGCSKLDIPQPQLHSVEPAKGWAGERTPIVIRGDGFVARTGQTSGGAPEVETGHRAWLGDAELEDVVRVDSGTLRATVPAGLPAGPQPLTVENAFGIRGGLEAAFEVVTAPGAVLSATLEPVAAFVSVGQGFTVRATVANHGSAPALGVTAAVTPSSGGGSASISAPTPASAASLAPGASVEFSWPCVATTAGGLSLSLAVVATDELSGRSVEGTAAASVTIQLPAGVVATAAANRATAGTGQAITVTFTVTNGGTAAAEVLEVVPSATPAPAATCTAPVPAPPLTVRYGESAAFTWTCASSAAGSLDLSGTARGADANSGEPLSATPGSPAHVVVQTPAALAASLSLPSGSTTASVGQPLAVVLTVTNGGGADAEVTAVTPTVTPAGAAACGTPTPAPPQIVGGGGSATFGWTCTPAVPGVVTLGASVAGVDRNTGTPLAATPGAGAAVTVQLPAALTAVVWASRAFVSVGQAVTVTLSVANGGNAAALVSSVALTPAGTATANCGTVTPAPPRSVAAGQALAFAWTCTPSTAGTLALSGTASGSDVNSGAPLVAVAGSPAVVEVQAPAALAVAAFAPGAASAVVGQAVGLTLTVMNSGTAAALLWAVTPWVSPAGTATCSAAVPAPPVTIAGGASQTFTWTCTGSAAGSYDLGASLAATDANSGAALPVSTPQRAIVVRLPAELTATIVADRGVATVGQAVRLTFTVATSGTGPANVTGVTPSVSGGGATCGAVAPGVPQLLGAGESLAFTWTCTPSSAGSLVVTAAATGTDATSGAALSATPATAAGVAVQEPPALAASAFTATRTTASVGQAIGLALTLGNAGGATAVLSAILPTVEPASSAACTVASPTPPASLPGGGSVTFTWQCTGTLAGGAALGAALAAIDLNTGSAAEARVTSIPVVFEAPAALSATSFSATPATAAVGEPMLVTLALSNTGSAAANVSSVTPTTTPGAGIACTASAPAPPQAIPGGGSLVFGWSCTASDPGGYVLRASVAASDANSGAALAVPVPTVPVTVAPPGGP